LAGKSFSEVRCFFNGGALPIFGNLHILLKFCEGCETTIDNRLFSNKRIFYLSFFRKPVMQATGFIPCFAPNNRPGILYNQASGFIFSACCPVELLRLFYNLI
jgi:hypothetical protein